MSSRMQASSTFQVGTPPGANRPPTPNNRRRSSSSQRTANIVPFTVRPSEDNAGSLHGSSWDGDRDSFSSRSLRHTRSMNSVPRVPHSPFSAGDSSGSQLHRPVSLPVGTTVPFTRHEGFQTDNSSRKPPAFAPATPQRVSALSMTTSTSLLSRQLSKDPSTSLDEAQQSAVKETLERSHSKPAARPAFVLKQDAAELLKALQASHSVFQDPLVVKAFSIAASAFDGYNRANGDPVLFHATETGRILAELGLDAEVVAAGILHDVTEDSHMTEEALKRVIRPQVAEMVSKVTKISALCQAYRNDKPLDKRSQQQLMDTVLCMGDARVVLVKLADRLHNLRTLGALPSQTRQRLAKESVALFSPLANRLGVWGIKAEIEDLCFKELYPQAHAELHSKLRESQNRGTIEAMLDKLYHGLKDADLSLAEISGRPKNLWGVHNKMLHKGHSLDQVFDVRAVRIIVKSKGECYQALRQVHRMYKRLEGREDKDYIKNPKDNGYQSLHTVVVADDGIPVEVQIRTDKMHFMAEYGLAAHWRYKEGPNLDADELAEQQMRWARWQLAWQLEIQDAKLRPSGSPGRDNSLASLVEGAMLCQFPGDHHTNCQFRQYVSKFKLVPSPVSQEALNQAPINVLLTYYKKEGVVQNLERIPPQCTPSKLAALFQTGLHSFGPCKYGIKMLVNHMEVEQDTLLQHGDQIEVWPAEAPALMPKPQRPIIAPEPPKSPLLERAHSALRGAFDAGAHALDSLKDAAANSDMAVRLARISSTELAGPPQAGAGMNSISSTELSEPPKRLADLVSMSSTELAAPPRRVAGLVRN